MTVHIPKGRYWSSRLSTLPIIPLTRTTQHLQLDRHLVRSRDIIKFTSPSDEVNTAPEDAKTTFSPQGEEADKQS